MDKYKIHKIISRKEEDKPYNTVAVMSKVSVFNDHIPMLKYENMDMKQLYFDIINLIKKFKLSECRIFKKDYGYDAIFFYNPMNWKKVMKIVKRSKVRWDFKAEAEKEGRIVLYSDGSKNLNELMPEMRIPSPYKPNEEIRKFGEELIKKRVEILTKSHNTPPKKPKKTPKKRGVMSERKQVSPEEKKPKTYGFPDEDFQSEGQN